MHRRASEPDDPALFARYRSAADYAGANRVELEELIRPTGFYRNKANSIIGLGQALVERFDGEVPGTLEEPSRFPDSAARRQTWCWATHSVFRASPSTLISADSCAAGG